MSKMRKLKMATILLYGNHKFSYIHPQISSEKIVNRQFWNASVHKATVAGNILSCILACSMRGNIAGRWGATWRCIHSTFSLPPEKDIGRTKNYHLWWPYLPKTGSWGCNIYLLIGSVQQPELHVGWMITTKLVSAQIIRNKLREDN